MEYKLSKFPKLLLFKEAELFIQFADYFLHAYFHHNQKLRRQHPMEHEQDFSILDKPVVPGQFPSARSSRYSGYAAWKSKRRSNNKNIMDHDRSKLGPSNKAPVVKTPDSKAPKS